MLIQHAFLRSGVIADSEDTIKAAADALGKQGFINYFGLQVFSRFFLSLSFSSSNRILGIWHIFLPYVCHENVLYIAGPFSFLTS